MTRSRLLLALLISSCMFPLACQLEKPLRVHVRDGSPVRFTLANPDAIGVLFVFKLSGEPVGEGISPERFRNDDPSIMWWIEGRLRKGEDLTYGSVPVEMQEITAAKPLEEGIQYLIYGRSRASGGMVGTRFVIQDGKAREIE